MKRKIGKSIASMVLAAVMCLSLLPMAAFAAEDGRPNGWMEVTKNVWHVDPESGYRYLIDDYMNIHWDISGNKPTGKEQSEQERQEAQKKEDEAREKEKQAEEERWAEEDRKREEAQQEAQKRQEEEQKQSDLKEQQRKEARAQKDGIQLLEDKGGFYFILESGVLARYEFLPAELHVYGYMTKEEWVNKLTGVVFDVTDDSIYTAKINSITEIVIPSSITSIQMQDLSWYPNLKSVIIPNSVTSIGAYTFNGCKALTSIAIPNSVTSIGESAFESCESLTSITIPNSVTSIGKRAFLKCKNLKDITLSTRLTSIEDETFAACGIENFIIPDHITSIGSGAFASDVLKSLTIPPSVTSIHENLDGLVYGLTIYGVSGSAAETYVNEHNAACMSGGSLMIGSNPIKFVPTNGTTIPATPTTTDKPSAWAETQVNAAVNASIVPQALQGQYTQATTRAEFAALAVALYEKVKGVEIAERQAFNDTTDVNIQKAAAIGVVSGVGNNNFAPNDKLTREQAATMLSRLAAAIGKPLTEQAATFADNGNVSSWAAAAVGQMQASGIMGGVGDNTFAPQDDYTREQSIATALRLYDIVK